MNLGTGWPGLLPREEGRKAEGGGRRGWTCGPGHELFQRALALAWMDLSTLTLELEDGPRMAGASTGGGAKGLKAFRVEAEECKPRGWARGLGHELVGCTLALALEPQPSGWTTAPARLGLLPVEGRKAGSVHYLAHLYVNKNHHIHQHLSIIFMSTVACTWLNRNRPLHAIELFSPRPPHLYETVLLQEKSCLDLQS